MRRLTIDELTQFDTNTRFNHPNFEFRNIVDLIKKVGPKKFLESPQYDADRDMMIACMFAYAIRMLEKREWFLRRGDNPPDFEMVTTTSRKLKEKPIDFVQVEIVKVPVSFTSSNQAVEMIKKKKLSNYVIGDDNILLIFINHPAGPMWSGEIGQKLEIDGKSFSQVWAIYILEANAADSFIYCVRCLKPGGEILKLSLRKEFMKGLIYPNEYIEKLGAKII
jgi:hypothetical protein